MKKVIILSMLCISIVYTNAQTFTVNKRFLNEKAVERNIMRPTYYFSGIKNVGKTARPDAEEAAKNYFTKKKESEIWFEQQFFNHVDNSAKADLVISGKYSYTAVTKENRNENELNILETVTRFHKAHLQVILTYEYNDGSPTFIDTINIYRTITQEPGPACKNMTLQLAEDEIKDLIKDCKYGYLTDVINKEEIWFNFPKIKIKDQNLKAEFAAAEQQLKDGRYKEAGEYFKKVHESVNTPESSQALGLCYELIGNYPKATEYFKAKPDFHINTRMKKNMKLLEYAKSIGIEPEFLEL